MRATMISMALLVGIFAASNALARPGPAVNVNDWAQGLISNVKEWGTGYTQTDNNGISALEHRKGDRPSNFTLLVKYIVRPSLAREFSEQQLKVRDEAKKQKGFQIYTLSKPLTDNVLFYTYQVWESEKDFAEYTFESKDTEIKKLAKYVEEKDIPLTLSQLIPFASHKPGHGDHRHGGHVGCAHSFRNAPVDTSMSVMMNMMTDDVTDQLKTFTHEAADTKVQKYDPRSPKDAIVLVKYVVKPSQAFKFVHAAEHFAEESSEEKGTLVYGFSKPLTDDYSFYSYAVFEGKEAAKEHLETRHTKEFFKFILSEDVLTTTTILLPIETLE